MAAFWPRRWLTPRDLPQALDLEIDESNLTGETKPRRKNIDPIGTTTGNINLAERCGVPW